MVRKIFTFIVFSLIVGELIAQEIAVSGIYQGKNLMVMNPFASAGSNSFCISQIIVNGKEVKEDTNSSTYEIELSDFQLKTGDKVEVVIKHKSGCKPRVLNPDAVLPRSTFEMQSPKFDMKTNILRWETTKETGALPFTVERFRWNKWVKIGTVEGTGNFEKNTYTFPVELHSGLNRFRVRQSDFTGNDRISKVSEVRSTKVPVTYEPKKPDKYISFSSETDYEIFNMQGARILYGRSKSINIESLPKGDYYLNYDATTEPFKKSK